MKIFKGLIITILINISIIGISQAQTEEAQVADTTEVSDAEDISRIRQLWNTIKSDAAETWNNPTHYSLFVPVNTWHNRWTYDDEKIDEYNEMPWGLGLGMTRHEDKWNLHTLYFMAFKDSNYHVQTIFGYAYQRNWYIGDSDWHYGAGYTLSLTQREEYEYIPLPLPVPLVGFGYKNLSAQMAYVPGTKNMGNVAFTWIRADF